MSKILKGNYLFRDICIGSRMNKNYSNMFYNCNKKYFVYNKKDEIDEFGKKISFDSHF